MNLEGCSPSDLRTKADDYIDRDWAEIRDIDERDRNHKVLKAEAWARKAVATDALPERLDLLQDLARDDDWRVREGVAMALKHVNGNAFERVERSWYDWVDRDDPNVRRACEVGLMRVQSEHVDAALRIFDELVDDSNDYVKKSCGAFALSHVASKDPEAARPHLDRWSRSDDLRTRWNVAKAIGSYGRTDEYAMDLAYRLAGDEEYRVRRATASAVKKLTEKRPQVSDQIADWDDRDDFKTML